MITMISYPNIPTQVYDKNDRVCQEYMDIIIYHKFNKWIQINYQI